MLKNAIRMSPAARILAAKHNLSSGALTGAGTGKHGILTKGDVLAFLSNPNKPVFPAPAQAAIEQPAPKQVEQAPSVPKGFMCTLDAEYTDIPLTTMRSVIAQRLLASKQNNPHFYVSTKCDITAASAFRANLKALGIKLSLNDVILLAVSKAMTSISPTALDVSVAVATPTGLITPIVKNTRALGLSEINAKVKDLAGRAREGKLALNEFQGGDFTVSNLGMFGIDAFTAVINDPQPAILAIGTSNHRARLKKDVQRVQGKSYVQEDIEVYEEMEVYLTVDRKRVEEHAAGEFLQTFSKLMSNPMLLQL